MKERHLKLGSGKWHYVLFSKFLVQVFKVTGNGNHGSIVHGIFKFWNV